MADEDKDKKRRLGKFGDDSLEFVIVRGPNGEPIEVERENPRELPGQGETE